MEDLAMGAHFDTLDISPVPENPVTLLVMMKMLWLDAVVYMLITCYIENVFPGNLI